MMGIRNRATEEIIDFVESDDEEGGLDEEPIDVDAHVRVKILQGISHAFFLMYSFLPEAKQATTLTSDWFLELLDDSRDQNTEFMMDLVQEEQLFHRRITVLANTHMATFEGRKDTNGN
jgi:hypothetical protein